jgi:hypothetical protein
VRTEAAGERVLELDYDRYAEAEHALGWVNLTGSVRIPVGVNGAEWMGHVLKDVAQSARSATTQVAHVKAWLNTPSGSVRGHVVGVEREASIAVAGTPVGAGRMVVNARAPVSPEAIQVWVEQAILQAGERFDAKLTPAQASAFRPARPVPMYRLMPVIR